MKERGKEGLEEVWEDEKKCRIRRTLNKYENGQVF